MLNKSYYLQVAIKNIKLVSAVNVRNFELNSNGRLLQAKIVTDCNIRNFDIRPTFTSHKSESTISKAFVSRNFGTISELKSSRPKL